MKKLLYAIALIVAMQTAFAIGVSPAITNLDYEPGKEANIKLRIFNNEHKAMQLFIYAKGELSESVKLEQNIVKMSSDEGEKIIIGTIEMPETQPEPGPNEIEIVVMEIPEEGSVVVDNNVVVFKSKTTLTATQAVVHKLVLNVPYPGKYLGSQLFVTEAESNGTVRFDLPLYHYGSEDISEAYAIIEILGPTNERITRLETEKVAIQAHKQARLSKEWKATVNSGKYYAKATIIYDSHTLLLEKTFNVGDMFVDIINIKAGEFKLGQVGKFDILLENRWNQELKGVYGDITIYNLAGQEQANFKTSSIDLQPLIIKTLPAYWDTMGVSVGSYDMKLLLRYSEKVTEKVTRIQVNIDSITTPLTGDVIAAKSNMKRDSILLMVIILLVLLNIGWFVYIMRIRKKHA